MSEEPARAPVPVIDPAHHASVKDKLARLELLCGLAHVDDEGHVQHLPAWLRKTGGEARWPATLAVLALIVLQLVVPDKLAFKPRPLLPVLESVLLVLLIVANPRRITRENRWLRSLGLLLVVAASLATAWSAGQLVYQLVTGHGGKAVPLLLDGGAIWLTNVIVFSLWYWEFDRGGPAARAVARKPHPDFLFTQMTSPELVSRDWEPTYVDYLYLSFTNATAFSPTDTLPLTGWAKLTMMGQSMISLITVALVVARAVNIFT
ncbi:MAG TPA: hypothetical protein VJT31_35320 [Rugosimonospora sp.]|nr:hypothetical protein [Rugosimonospora sp.]